MRGTNYRVWDKTENRMVYDGEPFILITNHGVFKLDPLLKENRYYLVDVPIELMQYTGLQDRNDKEMYEGDVLKREDDPGTYVICYDIFQTKYKAVPLKMYHANAGNGGWTGYELRYHLEVIGNIYEHPHLLKGE